MSQSRVDPKLRTHRCPVNGCTVDVDHAKLMCGPHWAMVPEPVQRAVYRYWDHGRGEGTAQHGLACDNAIGIVNRKLAAA